MIETLERTDVPSLCSAPSIHSPEMGDGRNQEIPVAGGRSIRVRPCDGGGAIQLAIVSTRGNAIESVTLDASQIEALKGLLGEAQEAADRELTTALEIARARSRKTYKEALARNPWLNGSKSVAPDEIYIRRPR